MKIIRFVRATLFAANLAAQYTIFRVNIITELAIHETRGVSHLTRFGEQSCMHSVKFTDSKTTYKRQLQPLSQAMK